MTNQRITSAKMFSILEKRVECTQVLRLFHRALQQNIVSKQSMWPHWENLPVTDLIATQLIYESVQTLDSLSAPPHSWQQGTMENLVTVAKAVSKILREITAPGFGNWNTLLEMLEKWKPQERFTPPDFFSAGVIKGFEVRDKRDAPPDITPKTLWNLWDIAIKFGGPVKVDRKSMWRDFISYGKGEIVIDVGPYPKIPGHQSLSHPQQSMMIIAMDHSHPTDSDLSFSLKNHVEVIWDRRLWTEKVIRIIRKIDREARKEDWKCDQTRNPMFDRIKLDNLRISIPCHWKK